MDWGRNAHKLVHLDLKGAPPKPSYFTKIFPLLKKWGTTGLLIEWEDSFPYEAPFEFLSSNIYSKDDVLQIIEDAKLNKLEVIPLIQTFGHLEFVLKHKDLIKYREVPLFPSSLCPSLVDSVSLVTAIVEQVLKLHSGVKYIHIGGDEVWHMALCNNCKLRIQSGETREDLFLSHIKKIITYIKTKWQTVNVIMWDDMFRDIDDTVIAAYDLKEIVELMVWHYNSSETFNLPADIWRKYSMFNKLWAASAYKGATGGSQLIPPISHHASNHLHWTSVVANINSKYQGIALTGWSRYDHFASLCELLPVSLPSLGVCLKVLEEKSFPPDLIKIVENDLGFTISTTAMSVNTCAGQNIDMNCERELLFGISKLISIKNAINTTLSSDQLSTWMNEWQVAHNRVNPMQLVTIVPVLQDLHNQLVNIEKHLSLNMQAIYCGLVIDEWIGTYVNPLKQKLTTTLQTTERLIDESRKFVEESLVKTSSIEMDC